MADAPHDLIARRVREDVLLRLGPRAVADAQAGRRIMLSGTEADAIARAVFAALASQGLVIARRGDVRTAWAWAEEAITDLPEAQEMDSARRAEVTDALNRLHTLLRTPQSAPEDSVIGRVDG